MHPLDGIVSVPISPSGKMLVNIGGSGHCIKTISEEVMQAAERDAKTTIGISGIV